MNNILYGIKDGSPIGRYYLNKHYSSRGSKAKLFIGPGQKLILLSYDSRAIIAFRKFISDNNQEGVNCCLFRNESEFLSSDLIKEAELLAWDKWPGQRLYTYVNPLKIKSTNPGYCFIMAGWHKCGITKKGLIILEKKPI